MLAGVVAALLVSCVAVVAAATTLDLGPKVGDIVGPVKTDFGWHVIEARPWSEVADSATALFKAQAGELLYVAYATGLPVRL